VPKEDTKFLPLYVIGSEGVTVCMACRMALTDCAKHLMSVASKCRMAGYRACKQIHTANKVICVKEQTWVADESGEAHGQIVGRSVIEGE